MNQQKSAIFIPISAHFFRSQVTLLDAKSVFQNLQPGDLAPPLLPVPAFAAFGQDEGNAGDHSILPFD